MPFIPRKCKPFIGFLTAVLLLLYLIRPEDSNGKFIPGGVFSSYDAIPSNCNQIPPIYYVKIHKTGSTTLQNILYRVGMRRNMFFCLFACPYGMTYPNPPKKEYMFANPTAGDFTGYSLITDHTMFDSESYKNYMPSNTKVITLLRHPLPQLKSTLNFWNLPSKFGIPASSGNAIMEYVTNPEKYEQTRLSFACAPNIQISQTRNPQCHHLGLKNQSESRDAVLEEFVKDTDKQMSLVLILERFEESLILLKRYFCLTTLDILHLNLFSTNFFYRGKYSTVESEEADLSEKLRSWSKADFLLYEHFDRKLSLQIEAFGSDFQKELNSFREVKEKVRNFCSESCAIFGDLVNKDITYVKTKLHTENITISGAYHNEQITINRGDCALMMFETLIYDEAIKAKQWPQTCEKNFQSTHQKMPSPKNQYCNKDDHVVSYFPWEILKNSPYFRKESCLKNF